VIDSKSIVERFKNAGALTDASFERLVGSIEKNVKDMQSQVARLGGVKEALERGHAQTLQQQLNEISSSTRVLQRSLGE
jgi:hypothetical protein